MVVVVVTNEFISLDYEVDVSNVGRSNLLRFKSVFPSNKAVISSAVISVSEDNNVVKSWLIFVS